MSNSSYNIADFEKSNTMNSVWASSGTDTFRALGKLNENSSAQLKVAGYALYSLLSK